MMNETFKLGLVSGKLYLFTWTYCIFHVYSLQVQIRALEQTKHCLRKFHHHIELHEDLPERHRHNMTIKHNLVLKLLTDAFGVLNRTLYECFINESKSAIDTTELVCSIDPIIEACRRRHNMECLSLSQGFYKDVRRDLQKLKTDVDLALSCSS